MSSRYALAGALFAVLLGASSLASTAPAGVGAAAVTLSDTEASLESEGCGETTPTCDTQQKSDMGFTRFHKATTASFSNANGSIKAHSSQDTSLFTATGDLSRIQSEAAGDATYAQDRPDHPFSAFGGSKLAVTFSVDSPVDYSLLGSMSASADVNSACSTVRVFLDPGPAANVFDFSVASPPGCGPPAGTSFNTSGTLTPGFYEMNAQVDADATSQVRDNGFADGRYELRLLLGDSACTITITQPGLSTMGTAGDDVICGSSGADTILGLGGNDTIYGEGGRDTIEGGSGEDGLFGGNEVRAGDHISGGPGNDLIEGNSGTDDLFGEAGSDTLQGSEGADCLVGGPRKDLFKGEEGDDKLLAKDGGRDTGSGGPGPDRGRFDLVDDVSSVANRDFHGGC